MNVELRLREIEEQLRRMALDAQVRDWVAERPDRVGFARLRQTNTAVRTAVRRYSRWPVAPADRVLPFVSTVSWLVTIVVVLLLAPDAAAPQTLAASMATGLIVSQIAVTVRKRAVDRQARRAEAGPATIDDPYVRAELVRKIEECRAEAADPEAKKDLNRALYWLD